MNLKTLTKYIFFASITLLITFGSVYADQIVVGFTGTVQLVDDASCQCLGFQAGEPLVGYYSFDSSTPDALPDNPKEGRYQYSAVPNEMVIWIAQHEFRSNSANVAFKIFVLDDFSESNYDKVIAYEDNPIQTQGLLVDWMRLDLRDDTHTLLKNDSLVTDIPTIEEWTSSELVIMGQDYSVQASIHYMFAGYPTAVQESPCPTSNILDLRPSCPNPFNDWTMVNIELHEATDVGIEVFDVTGRLIYRDHVNGMSQGIHQIPVKLQSHYQGHLPSGLYVYRVRAGGEIRTSKFVVAK